ncbi:MAG: glycerophosphodiester phosphodiesterase [Microcoleus sp. PH2017_10_PVI_O_A]|uniref:glycerophosphodiester phosphodiesterase n=1 Tax=unclassified Microcoleus TaxID=2642155 RepID=UPI001D7C7A15|nr:MULTISPECIES: glycerophosphodiester phosphodiesterase family protein [unclassified Microcoleus]TAE81300.1 MAG: glycerophosphodiester phosphodiesterase [Oscillatoriales cyanobacterium]MCC3405424.1 glycerophosphodiester phosphodiesterase [Microcoleus sp. PH2017_10_PVI_O_A]MCC3459417.1 glycerophosphodiester phosphodiesterase [Microcoleus sp. PH2017_11_PCY_U_A]MCC3477697.1 glycerophosphodiester phosphodiesterase [Microcoleus sp. PH2017_12_PCY_D_A]MCC3527419.1 glycerophosphodiester phosphodieste
MNLEIIAHRGFSARSPENTLAAFELAIARGASSIEFDIQLSADSVPVVFHDATLDRITRVSGKVRETNFSDLQTLNAGKWFSDEFSDEKIPTLKEALGILKNVDKFLYFDVKPHCEWSEAEVADFVNTLNGAGIKEKCVITSFSDKFLEQVRRLDGDLAIGHIVANLEAYKTQLSQAVAHQDNLITSLYRVLLENPALIAETRNQGVDIVAWTVDDPEDMQKLIDLGVTRIVTNCLI